MTPDEAARLEAEYARVDSLTRREKVRAARQNREWQERQAIQEAVWKAAEFNREAERLKKFKEAERARSKAQKAANERKMVRILKRAAVVAERLAKGQDYETRMRRSRIKWDELIDDKYVVERQIKWERCTTALEMRKAGLTFRKIGEHLNICASRAQQLVWRAEWMRKRPGHLSPVERYLTESYVSPDILSIKQKRDVHAMKRTLEPFQFKPNRDYWSLQDTVGAIAPG